MPDLAHWPPGTSVGDLLAHEADLTNVHGIADTSLLARLADLTAQIGTHDADTSVHGIANSAQLEPRLDSMGVHAVTHGFTTGASAAANKAALQAAIGALSGQTGGTIIAGRGTFNFDPGILLHHDAAAAKSNVRIVGQGINATILKPSALAAGDAIFGTLAGGFRLENLTLDLANLSGSANGLRLTEAPLCRLGALRIINFNTTGWPILLEGCEECDGIILLDSGCIRGLGLLATANNPTSAGRFDVRANDSLVGAGPAVHIRNSDANEIRGRFQSWRALDTIVIEGSAVAAGGAAWRACRGTEVHAYFEENGNSQIGSRNIKAIGESAANPIKGLVVSESKFFASLQDNPSQDVYLENVDGYAIKRNYGNLGAPHVHVKKGPNATNGFVEDNTWPGTVEASSRPAFRARRTSGQSITGSGGLSPITKIRFQAEDFDTNSDFVHDADDSGGAAESRFTPTVAGTYQLEGQVLIENADDGAKWEVWIHKNGAAHQRFVFVANGAGEQAFQFSATVQANGTTDQFELHARNNGANTRNVGADSFFSGARAG